MKRNRLPSQIVLLVSVVLFAVLSIVWVSFFSIREQMNIEAAEGSKRLVEGRIKAFQEEVSLIASDYHNWTDIYLNAQYLDYQKLSSNYGITAERGDVFQYAELFDGPFPAPVSWSIGLGLEPQSGIINPTTQDALRNQIAQIDYTQRHTVNYFEEREGQLVMFSASYLLPEDDGLLANITPSNEAIGVIGKILSTKKLANMEREFSISNPIIVTSAPPLDTVNIVLAGVGGEPVAWLQWSPPKPGLLLFWKMFPIVSGISFTFVFISCAAALLLRVKTKELIEQEALSFNNARTDALTNLPNRFALREHLNRLSQRSDAEYAVLAIDLCRFKQINDTVGHFGGDAFLIEFAHRLGKLQDDTTFVSRYGGDEFFVAMCGDINLEKIIAEKCLMLKELSANPIETNGIMFDVQASKGMAIGDKQSVAQEEMLRRADRAMYSAKARGSQEVIVYDSHMESEDLDYRQIETELRNSLANASGFAIYYQPIASANKLSQTVKYEALARWSCPKLGPVSPEKFIHVAETSGLILNLGWVLLDLVCKDIKSLESPKRVSINISPAQLMVPGFGLDFVERIVGHGLSPSQIEVEVTEQIAVLDDITIAKELSVLADSGFSLALDDFGTGYSSIGYLTRMPFAVLKIDKSFVQSLYRGKQGEKMLKSMVGLARSMNLEIVAEGIETSKDADALRLIGADYLQGFYFGRPEPLEVHERRYQVKLDRELNSA